MKGNNGQSSRGRVGSSENSELEWEFEKQTVNLIDSRVCEQMADEWFIYRSCSSEPSRNVLWNLVGTACIVEMCLVRPRGPSGYKKKSKKSKEGQLGSLLSHCTSCGKRAVRRQLSCWMLDRWAALGNKPSCGFRHSAEIFQASTDKGSNQSPAAAHMRQVLFKVLGYESAAF